MTIHAEPRSSTPPLRVAFIGGGINSAIGRSHFNAIHLDALWRLEAGSFSRNPEINRQSAEFYGVAPERTYTDYMSLLSAEAGQVDAVIVLTPTSFHFTPIMAALELGVPVICEKALVARIEEWTAVREAERRTGGFLAVTYNYTGYPALREMRALVQTGRLGHLAHLCADMPQEGYLRRDAMDRPIRPQDWRLRDGAIPMLYLDLAVHLHQIVDYLTGAKPTLTSAFHGSCGNFSPVVDYGHAHVRYTNGIEASMRFGKSMLGHRNGLRIELFGTLGSAAWEQMNPEQLRFADNHGRIELMDRSVAGSVYNQPRYTRFKAGHPAGYIEAFANLYVDIREALLDWKRDGRWDSSEVFGSGLAGEGLQLLHAMADSARHGNGTGRVLSTHFSTDA